MFWRKRKSVINKELLISNVKLVGYQLVKEIQKVDSFDMSTCTPDMIAKFIDSLLYDEKFNAPKIAFSWYWSKRVLAWYNGGDTIYFNSRCLNRPMASLVGTYYHELIHVIDAHVLCYCGHGNNDPRGKEDTAPYWIGRKAKQLCKELK